MFETLLPAVVIVGAFVVCRFEFFSFGSFCNATAIEMRPGVLITCLIFIRCSVSKFKMENAHKQKRRENKNCTFFILKFCENERKKLTHAHIYIWKRSWVKYLYTKWTFRRIMLLRLILYVLCAYVCILYTTLTLYTHRFFSILLESMVLFGVALMRIASHRMLNVYVKWPLW